VNIDTKMNANTADSITKVESIKPKIGLNLKLDTSKMNKFIKEAIEEKVDPEFYKNFN